MKKILSVVLALAMLLSLASVAMADYSGDVKIWVAENVVDFTKEQVEAFKAANPEYAGMNASLLRQYACGLKSPTKATIDKIRAAVDNYRKDIAAGLLIDRPVPQYI